MEGGDHTLWRERVTEGGDHTLWRERVMEGGDHTLWREGVAESGEHTLWRKEDQLKYYYNDIIHASDHMVASLVTKI